MSRRTMCITNKVIIHYIGCAFFFWVKMYVCQGEDGHSQTGCIGALSEEKVINKNA